MRYYVDFEGGSEICFEANSEAEAIEMARKLYGGCCQRIKKYGIHNTKFVTGNIILKRECARSYLRIN